MIDLSILGYECGFSAVVAVVVVVFVVVVVELKSNSPKKHNSCKCNGTSSKFKDVG